MKKKLLKKTLTTFALLICAISFSQIDYTFDTDDEGFTVNGPGTSSSHSAATGILTATTGNGGSNLQLRKNANDIGDPTTLTTVLLDLKNNSNANSLVLQTVSAGVTTIETIAITAADTAEQSYQIDVPAGSTTWFGSFQLRLRFVNTAGNLDGGSIEVNRIQIVDPATLSIEVNTLSSFNLYPNPVKNTLNIKSQDAISNVAVYDLLGKEVFSSNNVSNTLDVSSLSNGVYLIRLTSNKGIATKRFVKE
jgi:hypothetical protein